MAISELVALYDQLTEQVESNFLSELLPKVVVLAEGLNFNRIRQWAALELAGYYPANLEPAPDVEIPDYRKVSFAPRGSSFYLRQGMRQLEEATGRRLVVTGEEFDYLCQFDSAQVMNAVGDTLAMIFMFVRSEVWAWLRDIAPHVDALRGGELTPSPVTSSSTWDFFISHASEDKSAVAEPLASALTERGYRVWYDSFSLTLGDSLRRSIDEGLASSRFGIVILSPHFFRKEWPRRELDGLAAREILGEKVILPVWHGVTYEDILRRSPILADRLGVSSSLGLSAVVESIERVFAKVILGSGKRFDFSALEWKSYVNYRFGYVVDYPAAWVPGPESQNGDGRQLCTGVPGVKVSVAAGHLAKEGFGDFQLSPKDAPKYERLTLQHGHEAMLGTAHRTGSVELGLSCWSRGVHFRMDIVAPSAFFTRHEGLFRHMINSFRIPPKVRPAVVSVQPSDP